MDFEIELNEEGLLTITPQDPSPNRVRVLVELSDSLFWKDMCLVYPDAWTCILSRNHQLVFPMTDYGYDLIADLQAGKKVEVMGRSMSEYEEEEWNS